jgi:hypothetical protein
MINALLTGSSARLISRQTNGLFDCSGARNDASATPWALIFAPDFEV